MNEKTVEDILEAIVAKDSRYATDAYLFVRDGLDYTVRKLDQPRHVTAQELLEGIRKHTLEEFGPMSKRVLYEWGLHSCTDIGNIVFNLVNASLLGKTEEDRIEDFAAGYDFNEAFFKPFQPGDPVATS